MHPLRQIKAIWLKNSLLTLFLAVIPVLSLPSVADTNDVTVPARMVYPLTDLCHGVAYYPELWPESAVDNDITEMKRLGINTVRMGEFAWARMEPNEGSISVDFFLRVMDKLYAAGIGTIFCTPTAAPPVWLTAGHPERCCTDVEGRTMSHGARQQASYDEPEVRAACVRIVEAVSKAVGHHPGLVAWQIDNELRCQVAEDYSVAAETAWHQWLKKRYTNIETLNEAWGTEIWSERYQNFDQVPVPRRTTFAHNASLNTAFLLFSREDIADFLKLQAGIIRRHSAAPITHNMNPAFAANLEQMCQNLDFAALDAYPPSGQWSGMIFNYDLFRAAKPDKPFYVMETSASHNGWLRDYEPPHPPGFLAAEAVSAYALGSSGFSYWLWRQQRTGAELPHGALMSAWGKPTIADANVSAVEAARRQLAPILRTSRPAEAEVGLTWSDRGRAFLETEPLGGNRSYHVDYATILSDWHGLLMNSGLPRDVRFEGATLTGLKLLITPAMPYLDEDFIQRVKQWVSQGGVWIAGPLTGARTGEHTVPTDAGLGALDGLAGVETVYSFPLTGTEAVGQAFGLSAPLSGWGFAFRPALADTQVVGTFHSDALPQSSHETADSPDLAFITERKLGRGSIVLLGAQPQGETGRALLTKLIDHYAAQAHVTQRYVASKGTLVCPRAATDGHLLWIVVNMDGKGGWVELPAGAVDSLAGVNLPAGQVKVPRYGYRVFSFDRASVVAKNKFSAAQ